MSEEDLKVVCAMELYGGSFVKQLAQLCHRADAFNLEKIKLTWPIYWDKYEKMAHE